VILGASNAVGNAAPKVLTITIEPGLATPSITSSSGATGKVGVGFAYSAAATNTPRAFTATGLPNGLTIDGASGVISGIPTRAGTFTVTLAAANVSGSGAPFTLTVTIDPADSAPAITSAASAVASSGSVFTYQTIATSGPILSYSATGLPSGLSMNSGTGLITGTPTVAGLFTVTLSATNVAGPSAPLSLVLNVKTSALAPVITSASTSTGTQGSAFTYTATASNMPAAAPLPPGNGYAAAGLPDGLAINGATGAISGTPSSAGSFSVLLTATNDIGTSAPRLLTITVRAPLSAPQITSSNSAAASANSPFSYQIRGTNTPTLFDAGERPAWLAIDTATGILSGVPPFPGSFPITLVAGNSAGVGTPMKLTITATPAPGTPVITSGLSATGTAGAEFTTALAASNGPITSWFASSLPAGLTLTPTSGVISGKPAEPGVFRIEVRAANANGVGGSRFLTLNVAAAAGTPIIGPSTGSLAVGPHPHLERRTAASAAADYAEFRALSDGDASLISAGARQIAAAAGLTATGIVAEAFSYQVNAAGSPTGYFARNLPPGLAINPSTGLISGAPTTAGVYDSEIGARNPLGIGASVPFTITIRAPASAPTVTSSPTATGTAGSVFSYQISADRSPTSYNATGLPDELALNSTTGAISGVPTLPGRFKIKVSANNAAGSGAEADLLLILDAAADAPAINSTATASGMVRAAFTYQATASGRVTAWTARNLPAGVDIDSTTGLITGTPAVDGVFNATLTARNASGMSSPFTLRVTVAPSSATSTVTNATAATVAAGSLFAYQIIAGNSPVSYNADGLPPGLTLNAASGIISGSIATPGTYVLSVSANNAAGTGPVASFSLTVTGASVTPPTILSNISTRTNVGSGAQTLISGFVIAGDEPRAVLIRAVGPTLAQFNLNGLLADPVLEIFRGDGSRVTANDSWGSDGNSAALAATAARVGAFALPIGSLDAVISTTLPPGAYTAHVRGASAARGVGLVEIYDAAAGIGNSRITNLSARGAVGTGESVLIAGFVIRGAQPKSVLIRAVGPTLAAFGVNDALADPRLQVFSGSSLIESNDNWTDASAANAALRSGAFSLATGSKDAAIVVVLQPGAYTAQVSGGTDASGVALVEVYELP
jgi:hypothetical protein